MINQEKIGKFIGTKRKQVGITQKELAEKLGISDKAVSKWETGRGMPDNSILLELCTILGISVNELLSGEELSNDNYLGKAEENMIGLIQKNEEQKRNSKWVALGSTIGFLTLIVGIFLVLIVSVGGNVMMFVDLPSLTLLLGVVTLVLGISGNIRYLFKGISLAFSNKEYDEQELRVSRKAVNLALVVNILAAGFICMTQLLIVFAQLYESEVLLPNVAVCMLPAVYALLLDLILLPIKGMLDRK